MLAEGAIRIALLQEHVSEVSRRDCSNITEVVDLISVTRNQPLSVREVQIQA